MAGKRVKKFMQGNEACAEGALYAGCNFFAGYPITPSTEVAEILSARLPLIDGKWLQMEDEIASIAATLGGALGGVAIIIKEEILLAIVGGIFVMEALSVILQVGYYKLSNGKRIFLMAPFHHHFEKKGWHEPKVVVRFWIVSVILGLFALATLKLR